MTTKKVLWIGISAISLLIACVFGWLKWNQPYDPSKIAIVDGHPIERPKVVSNDMSNPGAIRDDPCTMMPNGYWEQDDGTRTSFKPEEPAKFISCGK